MDIFATLASLAIRIRDEDCPMCFERSTGPCEEKYWAVAGLALCGRGGCGSLNRGRCSRKCIASEIRWLVGFLGLVALVGLAGAEETHIGNDVCVMARTESIELKVLR